jgi:hypothetical protein
MPDIDYMSENLCIMGDRLETLSDRLDAALQRIEALEIEVAKLKAPGLVFPVRTGPPQEVDLSKLPDDGT